MYIIMYIRSNIYARVYVLEMQQYYNISIYCNIYYCNTIQYGIMEKSIYCTSQYIVIYCNVCCLHVVNAQSLHHKNDWTSNNLDYTLQLLYFYIVIQGIYSFLYCLNPYFHAKCHFTKIQSNIAIWQYIAIHSNTIRNNGIDPYCFTPNMYIVSCLITTTMSFEC